MTKNEPAPTGANVHSPPGEIKPQPAQPPNVPVEAVVSLTPGEIGRAGVALGRLRLWMTGQLGDQLSDEDLAGVEAASSLVMDIRDQIVAGARAVGDRRQELERQSLKVIALGNADDTYARLAELMGVSYTAGEPGSILKLAKDCVAKLKMSKLRKG